MKTQELRKVDIMSKGEMDKNLLDANCVELNAEESQQVYGGSGRVLTSLWNDFIYLGGSIAAGVMEFSTQGGRNAGLSVK